MVPLQDLFTTCLGTSLFSSLFFVLPGYLTLPSEQFVRQTSHNSYANFIPSSSVLSVSQSTPGNILAGIGKQILMDVARLTGRSSSQEFQILRVESRTWPDGCLGLADPGQLCTQALVPGWEVVVGRGKERWIFRSDRTGRMIKLDALASSETASPKPVSPSPAPSTQFPVSTPPLPEQQIPDAKLPMTGQRTTVRLLNRTGAIINYAVITNGLDGQLPQGQLAGRKQIDLTPLSPPVTINFRRQDGGLLRGSIRVMESNSLEVTLTATTDLGLDRTALSIEPSGFVFLN